MSNEKFSNEALKTPLRKGVVSIRFWSVVEKRGQVYHEVRSYKRKQDAVNLLIKLKSESLTDYQLVSILNGC
jgi:hypothetical protein